MEYGNITKVIGPVRSNVKELSSSVRRILYIHNVRDVNFKLSCSRRYNPINTFDHGRKDAIDKFNRALQNQL